MHRILAALFVTLAVSFPTIGSPQTPALAALEAEQQALFDSIAPSVVFVASSRGFGSGFYVSEDLVLTNAHVVGKDTSLKVVLRGGKRVSAKLVEADEDIDLALLRVEQKGKPVDLAPVSAVRVGSWAGAIGHGEGGVWSFTTGMVSNVYVKPAKGALIQTQIPINQGNSGGPIFSRTGEVVGIATAKSVSGENLNFAVPVQRAIAEFDALQKACTCLRVVTGPKTQVFIDGKRIGKGPEVVVPVTRGEHEILVIEGSKSTTRRVSFPQQTRIELK